jgi:hypothetical protein
MERQRRIRYGVRPRLHEHAADLQGKRVAHGSCTMFRQWWCLMKANSSQVVVQPMQWASTKDIHEVEPISDKDSEILQQLREVLVKYNAIDRFGVTLIHKHFELQENEQLVEFTDVENRRLTIQPVANGQAINTIETSWKFSEASSGPHPLTVCVFRCYYDAQSTPQHVGKHVTG